MKELLPAAILTAALLQSAGCATPGPAPDSFEGSLQTEIDLDLCLTMRRQKWADTVLEHYLPKLRSQPESFFRSVVSRGTLRDTEGCDVMFNIEQGLTVFNRDFGDAYSAYTGQKLFHGEKRGDATLPYLFKSLAKQFRIGSPDYERLIAERKASGRTKPSRPQAASRPPMSPAAGESSIEPPLARPAVLSDIDELPRPRNVKAKAHAVVIGVERYRESLPKADFAAGDARLVAEYVRRLLGYPDENVALLTDDHATRGDFEKYFERWLPNRVEPGDDVLVYYSGHGAPGPKSGDAFLVPYDGDPTYVEQTGYPLKRLYAQLAKLPAGKVTVVMDSCFSGAGGRSVIAKGARPLVLSAQAAPPAKVTVVSASAGDQISNSYTEQRHGLFTYFLLKGLKESGELRAAFDYAKPLVSRTARRQFNTDQDPQWREGRD